MIDIDNSKVKILLVDDTPENLEVAGSLLAKQDYDLYLADNGETAIELVENFSFDLILLDIMMPGMNGFEVCNTLKSRKEFKDIPIIFITAKVDIDNVIKGFEIGAVDYIRKPFNSLELLARVKTHVELKKVREEIERKNEALKEAYEKLEEIATIDPLTKLINRREMTKKIEEEKVRFERNKREFSFIIADIDHFKSVNDNYGHDCGDYILATVANILKVNIRKQDVICRWGGEEFLFLLPETDLEGAKVIAEKLRIKIQEHQFKYKGIEIKKTMTFGISVYSENQNVDETIINADKALYEGKQKSRNCVVLYNL